MERPVPPTQVRRETSDDTSSRASDTGAGAAAGVAPPEPATPDMFPVAFVTDPAAGGRADTTNGEPASPSKAADAGKPSAAAASAGAKGSIGKVPTPISSRLQHVLTRIVLSIMILAKLGAML